jgi:hypothetical protein
MYPACSLGEQMGIRFRKYIKLMPGVRLNLSKSGVSTTVGPRGLNMNIGKRGAYLNTGIPGTGVFARTKLSENSSQVAAGLPPPATASPPTAREKLRHVPIWSILIFFGTLITVGFMRRGALAALWILGWSAYFAAKLIYSVKRRVDQKRAERG